eukprot:Hpha_TRINITY_DN3074_c0_g1::TRINITY_DN3074_c0_g1_i1::g.138609::m.138609
MPGCRWYPVGWSDDNRNTEAAFSSLVHYVDTYLTVLKGKSLFRRALSILEFIDFMSDKHEGGIYQVSKHNYGRVGEPRRTDLIWTDKHGKVSVWDWVEKRSRDTPLFGRETEEGTYYAMKRIGCFKDATQAREITDERFVLHERIMDGDTPMPTLKEMEWCWENPLVGRPPRGDEPFEPFFCTCKSYGFCQLCDHSYHVQVHKGVRKFPADRTLVAQGGKRGSGRAPDDPEANPDGPPAKKSRKKATTPRAPAEDAAAFRRPGRTGGRAKSRAARAPSPPLDGYSFYESSNAAGELTYHRYKTPANPLGVEEGAIPLYKKVTFTEATLPPGLQVRVKESLKRPLDSAATTTPPARRSRPRARPAAAAPKVRGQAEALSTPDPKRKRRSDSALVNPPASPHTPVARPLDEVPQGTPMRKAVDHKFPSLTLLFESVPRGRRAAGGLVKLLVTDVQPPALVATPPTSRSCLPGTPPDAPGAVQPHPFEALPRPTAGIVDPSGGFWVSSLLQFMASLAPVVQIAQRAPPLQKARRKGNARAQIREMVWGLY